MQDQADPVGMFGDGLAHFHAVSRSLATHWYHVSLKRRHEDRFVAYEEMLNDEPRLVELLEHNEPPHHIRIFRSRAYKMMRRTFS